MRLSAGQFISIAQSHGALRNAHGAAALPPIIRPYQLHRGLHSIAGDERAAGSNPDGIFHEEWKIKNETTHVASDDAFFIKRDAPG